MKETPAITWIVLAAGVAVAAFILLQPTPQPTTPMDVVKGVASKVGNAAGKFGTAFSKTVPLLPGAIGSSAKAIIGSLNPVSWF